jgi:hypothetical protein
VASDPPRDRRVEKAVRFLSLADGIQVRATKDHAEARLTVTGQWWQGFLRTCQGTDYETKTRGAVLMMIFDAWSQRTKPDSAAGESLTEESEISRPAADSEGEKQSPKTFAPLDEAAVASALLEKGHALEAAFVRHFRNRSSSSWLDVIEAVCPGEEREWGTVKTWVNRVNNALADVDPDCPLRFSTSQRSHMIIKRILPE